jgi:UDP-N-acetylglucosamine:LPS N-acetylglucosamine transferase
MFTAPFLARYYGVSSITAYYGTCSTRHPAGGSVSGYAASAAPRVAVISGSMGAGHDGAARELVRELAAAGYATEFHDFLDLLGPRGGRALRALYARQLRLAPRSWGWLLGNLGRHPVLNAGVAGLLARAATRRMRAALGPDLSAVVSTYPLASQALGRLRRRGELAVPAVTFLTDLSVHPLWIAPGIDLHLALHEVAAGQARTRGAGRVDVVRPLVAPAFAESVPAAAGSGPGGNAAAERMALPVDGPVALVVAGSWGVGEVAETAAEIAATGLATPVTLCGNNAELRRRIAAAGTGVALGWVTDMPALVRAAGVVVQNAGGLTSLEAMAAGVPVISYRCLPGHGTTNAAALDRAGLAPWVTGADGLADALRVALADGPPPAVERLFAGTSAVEALKALVP